MLSEDTGRCMETYEDVLQHVNSETSDRWIQCKKTINEALREYDELVTHILEKCQPSSEIVKRLQWYKSRNLAVDDDDTLNAIRKNKDLYEALDEKIEVVFGR
jgi:hypothetical protein